MSLLRIKNGELRKGDKITVMSTGHEYTANSLGVFTPKSQERESLSAGEVGFLIAGIKDIYGAPVGDTITTPVNPSFRHCQALKPFNPGFFPACTRRYLRTSKHLEKHWKNLN